MRALYQGLSNEQIIISTHTCLLHFIKRLTNFVKKYPADCTAGIVLCVNEKKARKAPMGAKKTV